MAREEYFYLLLELVEFSVIHISVELQNAQQQ
jgi:hypothetical protein